MSEVIPFNKNQPVVCPIKTAVSCGNSGALYLLNAVNILKNSGNEIPAAKIQGYTALIIAELIALEDSIHG